MLLGALSLRLILEEHKGVASRSALVQIDCDVAFGDAEIDEEVADVASAHRERQAAHLEARVAVLGIDEVGEAHGLAAATVAATVVLVPTVVVPAMEATAAASAAAASTSTTATAAIAAVVAATAATTAVKVATIVVLLLLLILKVMVLGIDDSDEFDPARANVLLVESSLGVLAVICGVEHDDGLAGEAAISHDTDLDRVVDEAVPREEVHDVLSLD